MIYNRYSSLFQALFLEYPLAPAGKYR